MSAREARQPRLTVLLWVCAAVQASIAANTYVVSGPAQTKSEPPKRCKTTPLLTCVLIGLLSHGSSAHISSLPFNHHLFCVNEAGPTVCTGGLPVATRL